MVEAKIFDVIGAVGPGEALGASLQSCSGAYSLPVLCLPTGAELLPLMCLGICLSCAQHLFPEAVCVTTDTA